MCYYIGWSYDKQDNIFYEEDKKDKIDKRVKQMQKMIAKKNIPFDYTFVKNNTTLLKLSIILPYKYEKMRRKILTRQKNE